MRAHELAALADAARPAPYSRLTRGEPAGAMIAVLAGVRAEELTGPAGEPAAGRSLLAALWTYADGFAQAHALVQDDADWTATWVHAILHRREPDPGNASYWYRRVRPPAEVVGPLAEAVQPLVAALPDLPRFARLRGGWDGTAFVTAAEGPVAPEALDVLLAVQRLEWRALLEACLRRAAPPA